MGVADGESVLIDDGDLAALRSAAAAFVRDELSPCAASLEEDAVRSKILLERAAARGIAAFGDGAATGAMAWNGGAPELVAGAVLLEEVARGCAGFAMLLLAQGLASIASGSFLGRGLDEPAAFALPGSRIAWGGGCARRCFGFETTREATRAIAGEPPVPALATLGLRAAHPHSADVGGPVDVLDAGEKAAATAAMTSAIAAVGCSAIAAGLAHGAVDVARAYAAERFQGGDRIERLAIVKTMLGQAAACARRAELLARAAALRFGDRQFGDDALAAYLGATSGAVGAATDALQVMGGYGYMREYGLEKRFRDAEALAVVLGSPDACARRLAGSPS